MMPWHRLFGIALSAYLKDSGWVVELEKDLSSKQQLLDVAVVRRGIGNQAVVWPDGFELLATHNLITFKSLREPLNAWSLQELVGHYVNYRKCMSVSLDELTPADQFALFAATVRYPRDLAKELTFQNRGAGIYDVQQWGLCVRMLVFSEIPEAQQNALWNLFSGDGERVAFGLRELRPRLHGFTSVMNLLFDQYDLEGIKMPYTMEQFEQEVEDRVLRKVSREKLLALLTAEERLKGLPAEERLKGLPAEERLKGLSAEELQQLREALEKRDYPDASR